ncbi:hypothetical protein ONV78_31395 [Hahella sp. CR1]|uniref:hypothetical protein n=1 Tax=Hahella sp. CR1 TaxID=2992807 RepID=UPI002442D97A|nr:hypothetical protein [Hahella sp. CR1]MDG9672279.1 hypothetical protein [Hahella sp. CR1]
MKIQNSKDVLTIDCGFLKPRFQILIAEVQSWAFVAEENGATYLSFLLENATQHVSISVADENELDQVLKDITSVLNMLPHLDIAEQRLNCGNVIMAVDGTLGVAALASILVSAVVS